MDVHALDGLAHRAYHSQAGEHACLTRARHHPRITCVPHLRLCRSISHLFDTKWRKLNLTGGHRQGKQTLASPASVSPTSDITASGGSAGNTDANPQATRFGQVRPRALLVTFSDSESGESSESSANDSLMSGAQSHVQSAIVVMKAAHAADAGSAKPFRAYISPMWGKTYCVYGDDDWSHFE